MYWQYLNKQSKELAVEELEQLCRQVWGAYEYLYTNNIPESGTSQRIRARQHSQLLNRLVEELAELRGVIEGSHVHEGFDQDIILEGYEVWYWAVCLAVSAGINYRLLNPHRELLAGFETPPVERPALLPVFDTVSQNLIRPPLGCGDELENLAKVFWAVGRACSLNGTSPVRLLTRDRDEMRQKAYLIFYWQGLKV
jgi:hypothetical protein